MNSQLNYILDKEEAQVISELEIIRSDRKLYPLIRSPKSFFIFSLANISARFQDLFDIPKPLYFLSVDEINMNCIFSEDTFSSIFSFVFEQTVKDLGYPKKLHKLFKTQTDVIDSLYRNLNTASLIDHTLNLTNLTKAMLSIGELGWIAVALDKVLFDKLIKHHNIKISNNFWKQATDFVVTSMDRKNKITVLEYLKNNSSVDWGFVAKLTHYQFTNYSGIKNLDEVEAAIKKEYLGYDSKLATQELEEINTGIANNLSLYNDWHKKLSDIEKALADLIQIGIKIRDDRKIAQGKGFVVGKYLVDNILKSYGLSNRVDYKTLTVFEILKGKDWILENHDFLNKRFENSFNVNDYENCEFKSYLGKGSLILDYYKKVFESQNELSTELRGNTAFAGKVVGRVRVVFSGEDFNTFQTGEILVTSMTRPEFVPLMKKASAVITDEGGITCHAAIVSRELKIPCIIGTRVVTQILKDGDLVEVDAVNGVVKILEKAKE